ncbi:metallophosphoesterase [Bradyrhizobium sp. Arg62]|uniref:metallophosphoesterase family protein n=1 Tax=Bradyrhizobium brasilense TaxID=1419277 RepID=UPI001E58630C|nr:metallophosphoesterase [Bradyrhizobium brasilense]MCC8944230.1 metallophosphoesterase [Bradyrhizobium brasilense]
MTKLRIGVVADIHAGATHPNIKCREAIGLLEQVVEEANARSVDLFVTLGDNVTQTSPEQDFHHLLRVKEVLTRVRAPVVPLFGNNDLKFLSAEKAAEALGCNATSELRRVNGWTLLFWRPSCSVSLEHGIHLEENDLAWLRSALETAAYPTVVFLHAPIDGHSMVGNYYFEKRPDLSGYSNAAAARSAIEDSGKVVLVLTGHVHWNAGSTIDGIHYRTLASLSDTFRQSGEASGAWGLLDLDPALILLEVFGAEPMKWSAPPRSKDTRWYQPRLGKAGASEGSRNG